MIQTIFMAIAAMVTAACSSINTSSTTEVRMTGKADTKQEAMVERTVSVADFDAVKLTGIADVTYEQEGKCRLVLKGRKEDLDRCKVQVKDGKLCIEWKETKEKVKWYKEESHKPRLYAYVYAPTLTGVEVTGAGDLRMPKAVKLDNALSVKVSGAGDIDMTDVKAKQLDVIVSGAGDVHMKKVEAQGDVSVTLSGAGDIDGNVTADDVTAVVSGAGDVDLTVHCNKLCGVVSGAGDAKFKGQCRSMRTQASGVGSVNTKQLKVTGK